MSDLAVAVVLLAGTAALLWPAHRRRRPPSTPERVSRRCLDHLLDQERSD